MELWNPRWESRNELRKKVITVTKTLYPKIGQDSFLEMEEIGLDKFFING